jgi:hypothetical protein
MTEVGCILEAKDHRLQRVRLEHRHTMFHSVLKRQVIWAYDYDLEAGGISGRREIARPSEDIRPTGRAATRNSMIAGEPASPPECSIDGRETAGLIDWFRYPAQLRLCLRRWFRYANHICYVDATWPLRPATRGETSFWGKLRDRVGSSGSAGDQIQRLSARVWLNRLEQGR